MQIFTPVLLPTLSKLPYKSRDTYLSRPLGKPLNKLRAYDAIAKHTFKYACEQVIEKEFVLTFE